VFGISGLLRSRKLGYCEPAPVPALARHHNIVGIIGFSKYAAEF